MPGRYIERTVQHDVVTNGRGPVHVLVEDTPGGRWGHDTICGTTIYDGYVTRWRGAGSVAPLVTCQNCLRTLGPVVPS